MKNVKVFVVRMLPMALLALFTLVVVWFIYAEMIRDEKEDCWNTLTHSAYSMAETMDNRFEGNMVLLDRVGDALHLETLVDEDRSVLGYLNKIQNTTMFARIDLLYPDGRLLCQDGHTVDTNKRPELQPYEELLALGSHVTERRTDPYSGKEVLYYLTPISSHGQVEGILVGTIECNTLREQFRLWIYDGKAQVYLVDRRDGSFLINDWMDPSYCIDQMEERIALPGYHASDFVQGVMEGAEGRVAYHSKDAGRDKYMYMTSLEKFPWQLCVAVSEEDAFARVLSLRKLLTAVGILLTVIVVLYVAINGYVIYHGVLKDEKVRQAEQERSVNEAKSRFLSSISHDIRTPLNGIIGMTDIIKRRGYEPEQVKESLRKIEVSACYLLTLANDVLDLTQIETTKIVLADEEVNVKQLTEDLEGLIQARAQEAGVTCHFDTSAVRHPQVMGSSVHLQRLLINLLTNAIKYNRKGGQVWLTVEESFRGKDKSLYRFLVRDNGIGMTEEFQKDMYKAFEQEHAGARTVHQGHGLGLSIVKRLVDAMQGTIQVESQKDVGTTFIIELPLQRVKLEAPQPAVRSRKGDIAGMNILLAEDNELNMEIATFLLTDAGARVIPTHNGREAVDTFQRSELFSIDAILMDVMMPEMDGLIATTTIRRLERSDAGLVPIIAMTASTFSDDVRRCKAAGMNHHMSKPLDMQALTQLLTEERTHYEKQRKEIT